MWSDIVVNVLILVLFDIENCEYLDYCVDFIFIEFV